MGRGSETCLCRRVVIRMVDISPDMRGMEAAVLSYVNSQICLPRSSLVRNITPQKWS